MTKKRIPPATNEAAIKLVFGSLSNDFREVYKRLGSAMWLDNLTAEEFDMLWDDCLPWLLAEGKMRGRALDASRENDDE